MLCTFVLLMIKYPIIQFQMQDPLKTNQFDF